MHDPMTVAFEFRYPWRAHRHPRSDFEREYRAPWLVVWHRDPCVQGDDDSCGWSTPRFSPEEKWVRALRGDLAFLRRDEKAFMLGIQRGREGRVAWELLWLERASFWHRNRGLSPRQIAAFLFGASFPGDRDDSFAWHRDEDERVAQIIARQYLRLVRPWWRHPRWHIHHWRFQVVPWQTLRRWLFSRCQGCGKRFRWGYAPLSTSWDPAPPKAFRSETHVYHFECNPGGPGEVAGG